MGVMKKGELLRVRERFVSSSFFFAMEEEYSFLYTEI